MSDTLENGMPSQPATRRELIKSYRYCDLDVADLAEDVATLVRLADSGG